MTAVLAVLLLMLAGRAVPVDVVAAGAVAVAVSAVVPVDVPVIGLVST
jgi:hypothetical protein